MEETSIDGIVKKYSFKFKDGKEVYLTRGVSVVYGDYTTLEVYCCNDTKIENRTMGSADEYYDNMFDKYTVKWESEYEKNDEHDM